MKYFSVRVVLTGAWLTASIMMSACSTTSTEDATSIQRNIDNSTGFTPESWARQVSGDELQAARDVDWLASFEDPLLRELVERALENNRDLQAAAANVDRARALAVQAGAQLKPQANLAFSSSRTGGPSSRVPEVSNQSLSLQLNWEADIWGRVSAGQQAAVASAEAAAADYKFAQHSIAAGTAKAYFVAVEAGLQVEILREILTSLEETARIVKVQYDNGLVSAQDLALTNSDLASTREQLITLETSRRDALRALEVLLGEYPRGEMEVRNALSTLPELPPPGVPSDLLERRPDIVAAERQVASAFKSLKQAKAARLPQLSLTGNLGGASSSLSDILDPVSIAWQLAGSLLVPVFDGGARAAQVDIANAQQEQALAAYAQTALTAFNEVESNLDLASSLTQRKEALETSQNEAERAYKIAAARYEEGEISLVDLLAIQQRVLSAKSNRVAIDRTALEQRVNLYLALGGEWVTNASN